MKHNSWWDYDFSKTDDAMSFADAKEQTKDLFEQAVTEQMVADVPVGAYLSGGMDSGSIASVASKQVDRLATFTCGFDMNEVTGREANFDERRDAELNGKPFKDRTVRTGYECRGYSMVFTQIGLSFRGS